MRRERPASARATSTPRFGSSSLSTVSAADESARARVRRRRSAAMRRAELLVDEVNPRHLPLVLADHVHLLVQATRY